VKTFQTRFPEIYNRQPILVISVFVAFYIPVIALNLPGAKIPGLCPEKFSNRLKRINEGT